MQLCYMWLICAAALYKCMCVVNVSAYVLLGSLRVYITPLHRVHSHQHTHLSYLHLSLHDMIALSM